MPSGFFAKSEMLASKAPASLVPKCGACGLYKTCQSPKMVPSGKGARNILIIGEAPGREEDRAGIQFVGVTGTYLEKTLKSLAVDMRKDCKLTNAAICRPPDNKIPKKRRAAIIEHCRPNLLKTIRELNPEIIIPLGGIAVESLLGHFWKEDVGSISRWAGFRIPSQRLNAWICPTFHPSYVTRKLDRSPVTGLIFAKHLEAAVNLEGRPWDVVPNYESQVERVRKTSEAARILREMVRRGGRVAFDYETNMLKPDDPAARIISAAACWEGKKTIAYPWHGEAIEATEELLVSRTNGIIASNLKFEDRWTRRQFGHGVRRWLWDTMVAAHVLDNRRKITGLKFQAFAWLGMDSYNDHIEPLMKAEKGKKTNLVAEEIEINQLLAYNGLDALLEFHVAIKQMKEFGYEEDYGRNVD